MVKNKFLFEFYWLCLTRKYFFELSLETMNFLLPVAAELRLFLATKHFLASFFSVYFHFLASFFSVYFHFLARRIWESITISINKFYLLTVIAKNESTHKKASQKVEIHTQKACQKVVGCPKVACQISAQLQPAVKKKVKHVSE